MTKHRSHATKFKLIPNKVKKEQILKALYTNRRNKKAVSGAALSKLIGHSEHTFSPARYIQTSLADKRFTWMHVLKYLNKQGLINLSIGTSEKKHIRVKITKEGISYTKEMLLKYKVKPKNVLVNLAEKTKEIWEEPKEEKKMFDLTPRLRYLNRHLMELIKICDTVYKPKGFFRKKYDFEAMKRFAKEKAEAQATFWVEAIKTYPELKGRSASANDSHIKLD